MKKKLAHTTAAFAAMAVLSACASSGTAPEVVPTRNIVEIASQNGNFNTLVTAVKTAGLASTLQGAGPFTVFAPTDAAFAKLPAGTVEALLADKQALSAILTYHVLSGKTLASDITRGNGAMPATVNGQALNITVRDGKVYVNNALVVTADIQATNGVIHVIDAVLLPKMSASGN